MMVQESALADREYKNFRNEFTSEVIAALKSYNWYVQNQLWNR
jgi:hypothetical protein